MIAHAQDHSAYVRRIREELDVLLAGTTQMELAELVGVAHTTIGRRAEQDDRLAAWPMAQLLVVAYELRKRFPGLQQALTAFFSREDLTKTRSMSVNARALEAADFLLLCMQDAHSAAREHKFSKREAREMRQKWALTMHAVSQFINAAEREAQS